MEEAIKFVKAHINKSGKITELQRLDEYETITNWKDREIKGVSYSGVRKVFEGLVKKELIFAFGDKKSRRYKL